MSLSEPSDRTPLDGICDRCTLGSPNIFVEPICSSQRQLWSVFYCVECQVKGLVNVSIYHPIVNIYQWSDRAPAAIYWTREWNGEDSF